MIMNENKLLPAKKLVSFTMHLVDECNLRCWGCDHFAPIAQGGYVDTESFSSDLFRIADLTNRDVDAVCFMGGEPLLHQELPSLFSIARAALPNTELYIMTNGILLPKKSKDFWVSCHDNNIKILQTKYPIKIDYKTIINLSSEYEVSYSLYDDSGKVHDKSYHIPLKINPDNNASIMQNWLNCFHANRFRMLKSGRMYPCTIAPNIIHFNKFFNLDIPISDEDGIDIYSVNRIEDILSFLSKPIPCCRNCDVLGRTFNHPWCRSKKQISEWTR